MNHHSDIAQILQLFPECPRVEQQPSIDAIVSEYLRQHDVNIKPVSSDLQPSRLTNAAMAAMGAGYAAANTHLTVQKNSAALQEWTTWKQWALSQPDFKDFKRTMLEKASIAQEKQDKWIEDNKHKIQVAIIKRRAVIERDNRLASRIVTIGIISVVALSGLTSLVDQYRTPNEPSKSGLERNLR